MKKQYYNRLLEISLCALACVVVMCIFSCRGGRNKVRTEFYDLLESVVADSDSSINQDEWLRLITYVEDNKNSFCDYYNSDGNKINEDALKDYIREYFSTGEYHKDVTFAIDGKKTYFDIKFYLERSGSMVPYDSPKCQGEFKSVIVEMLNNFPGNPENKIIFVVNDGVYHYPQKYMDFITDDNVFKTTADIGDAKYTDFGCILDSVLNKNGENEISILVSDMIYSTKDVGVVNTQKIFSEAKGITQAIFRERVKEKTVLLLQLEASFVGKYYPYNQPKGVEYSGLRPYYFLVVGSNENMARLIHDKEYKNFSSFDKLKGFKHKYVFGRSNMYNPYYAFVIDDVEQRGRVRNDRSRDEGNDVKSVKLVDPDRNTKETQLVLAVNLDNMFIDDDYLYDINNYRIEPANVLTIKKIERITDNHINQDTEETLGKATHRFILTVPELTYSKEVTISLVNKFPQWIVESSSDDDSNVSSDDQSFANRTFGLEHLMKGIYDCYRNQSASDAYYFQIKINLKK